MWEDRQPPKHDFVIGAIQSTPPDREIGDNVPHSSTGNPTGSYESVGNNDTGKKRPVRIVRPAVRQAGQGSNSQGGSTSKSSVEATSSFSHQNWESRVHGLTQVSTYASHGMTLRKRQGGPTRSWLNNQNYVEKSEPTPGPSTGEKRKAEEPAQSPKDKQKRTKTEADDSSSALTDLDDDDSDVTSNQGSS